MTTAILIIIGLAFVCLIAAAWLVTALNKRSTEQLRDRFGPEYDHTLLDSDSKRDAEAELRTREKRVSRLDIKPLADTQRQDYAERWRGVQARFVDDPAGAVEDADGLVNLTMTARGYPMADFEQRAADISVDHPLVVSNYRSAHAISLEANSRQATTEQFRLAMVHYRALFDELLRPEPAGARR